MADGSKIGTSVISSIPGHKTKSLTLSFESRAGSLPLSLEDDVEGLALGDAGGGDLGGGGCESGKLTASREDADPLTGESEGNADEDTGDCVT